MKHIIMTALGTLTLAAAFACGNETRQETTEDVAAARREAAQEVGEARQEAAEESAKGARDVALARAEGAYKIAIERCEALEGDAQSHCKDAAEADYDLAKRQAEEIAE